MIILGKTNDDKGTQLETLTRDILSKMGCKNIQINFVSSGGEEIDVTADYLLPTVGAIQYRRLVCECKAHAKPIDMPPWLKFLGMVYSEEARLNSEVSGCFISLSGVNGNVSGHYDQLKMKRPNIMLVKGDVLLDELKKLHDLCDVEDVNSSLARFTARRYRNLEVIYYDRAVYWIVIFEDDAYTILEADGSPLETHSLEVLKPMIEDTLSAKPHIGLKQEAEAQRRAIQAKKSVIAQVIGNNGSIKKSALHPSDAFGFTETEFDQAIQALVAEGWIEESTAEAEISFPKADDTIFYNRLAQSYQFLFGGELQFNVLEVIKSKFYGSNINERFVAEIQRIQGNLPLAPEDIELAMRMLKWSPSALLWAVQPDEMIVTHRNDPSFKSDASMDRFDRNYFFRQLHRCLSFDLKNHIARSYLLDVFQIREVQSQEKVIVKSSNGVELESDLNQRIGIGFLADALKGPDGTNSILMLMMENAPEPWDVAAWKKKEEVEDDAEKSLV